MKILHVETGMHLYGGALQASYLVGGLAARGVESLLVCPFGSALAAEAYPEPVSVFAVPMGGDLDLPFVGRIRRLIKTHHPDLVHLHSRRGADWLGGIGAGLAGVPAILSRRVTNPEPRWVVPIKYRLFDRVIAISRAIAEGMIEAGVPESKIRLVHSAVPRPDPLAQRRRGELLSEFGLPDNALIVGMAAQFIPRKGYEVLMGAIPQITARYPTARFLLFGQGPLQERIRDRAEREGLSESVRFTGFRKDLASYLGCLDLLVHPALDEGLGIVLLEACAAGIPVVATPVGGVPEVIRDRVNGLLVPAGDAEALAGAVMRLLEAKDLRIRLGRAGREIVEEEFSVETMVEGNLRVYRELT
ncbi:MAG: glycosyltransferase family 4 protein [Gammaproteobacteria bacterium]|nr:MAG: glycosyl transferase [Gammaproteobacteria bacterium SG8_31]